MDNIDIRKVAERTDLLDERLDHYKERLDNLESMIQEIKDLDTEKKVMKLTKSSHRWEVLIGVLVFVETVFGAIMLYNGFHH